MLFDVGRALGLFSSRSGVCTWLQEGHKGDAAAGELEKELTESEADASSTWAGSCGRCSAKLVSVKW